jgi:hypothetical protein
MSWRCLTSPIIKAAWFTEGLGQGYNARLLINNQAKNEVLIGSQLDGCDETVLQKRLTTY